MGIIRRHVVRAYRERSARFAPPSHAVDAWMTVNPADPGLSFSSSEPSKRIDYIYASQGGLQPPVPTHCEIVFDEPVSGTSVSDHLGVLCTFALPAVE